MDDKKIKIFALGIVIALPFFFFFMFKPLSKIKRPKTPQRLYATDTLQVLDDKGNLKIDSVYHRIPNYKLQTLNGDSLELDSLAGNICVLDFFFASCGGICPTLSSSLERVQQAFVKDHNFKIVSITVDPKHDSLPELRAYADRFNAVPGKWYFLRTSKEDVYELAKDGFYVTAKDNDGTGNEAFIHSEKLVLVDWNGNIRGYYSGVDSVRVNKLMGDIVLLLRETEKGFKFKNGKKLL
jgi:protein SCO1/2